MHSTALRPCIFVLFHPFVCQSVAATHSLPRAICPLLHVRRPSRLPRFPSIKTQGPREKRHGQLHPKRSGSRCPASVAGAEKGAHKEKRKSSHQPTTRLVQDDDAVHHWASLCAGDRCEALRNQEADLPKMRTPSHS